MSTASQFGGGKSQKFQEFLTSGAFTPSAKLLAAGGVVEVELYGGGGGGSNYGRPGGGVGLLGQGSSGAGGAAETSGSPGSPGSNGSGRLYGGGSADFSSTTGMAAVRIIWPGITRQFPSTNTGDM